MSNKRFDIQGVRAWAVLAVAIFHFFPSILPWGFLGVDVFFVLSGFLISLVLDRKPCVAATYLDFYFKRFKRIFPLAILVTLVNLLVVARKYDLTLVKVGARTALYALFFVTSYNLRDEGEDYFEALEEANDYFTHYWSLSVEIQFYVLAPLILHILKPSPTHPTRLLLYLSSLALCSLVLSLTLPPEDAFSSTLCRLWQFLAGAMAFNLGKMMSDYQQLPKDEEEKFAIPNGNVLYLIPFAALSIASVVILSFGDVSSLIRLSVTASATVLLIVQSTSPLLCHPYLQLFGDASYALYLIHWPVVCVLKDWEIDDPIYLLGALVSCIALSLIVHLTYEKWYLTLSEVLTFALVGVLYLLCFTMIFYNSSRQPVKVMVIAGKFDPAETLLKWEPGMKTNFTDEQVVQMNRLMESQLAESLILPNCTARVDKEKNDRFKFCQFPNGKGKDSFLIIGNSYALSPGKLVLKHFKKHYGKISIRAVPHCEPLIETKQHMCKDVKLAHKKFLEDLEREQPDILFISSRYENPHVAIVGNVTSDPIYLFMSEKLRSYEKLVKKKVFILNSFPLLKPPVDVEKMRKKKNLTIEGFMPEAIVADDEPMRIRIQELAEKCEKCVIYDIRGPHVNERGQFMVIDPSSKLRYFEKSVHYTSVGLKLIEPVFTQMSKDYSWLLKAKYPDNMVVMKH